MKRLFKRGRIKKKLGGKAIWKPETVLLCYDHHENIKQIEIESDTSSSSSSSENESDIETDDTEDGHKVVSQSNDDESVASGRTGRIIPFVSNHKGMVGALVVVIAFLVLIFVS